MQIDENFAPSKKIPVLKTVLLIVIWFSIIIVTVNFIRNQNTEVSVGKDIIRCIIDENASSLNSPACKRVISNCSNNNKTSCKKLLFYSYDGVHSEEALSILGTICGKGGEKACDVLINRCIENNSNCEILGKSYSIKNYLSMKSGVKNTGKSVMYKKIKNYYDKDVDNIVNSVINTCLSDKNSIACQIFTSKTYEFNSSEKTQFIMLQGSNSEISFSKTGISLAVIPALNKNGEEKAEDINKNQNDAADKDKLKNELSAISTETDDTKENPVKIATEKPVNTETVLNTTDKNVILSNKQSDITPAPVILKTCLTTSEKNNIGYIKNKIYSFNIVYKEPVNTKIRWLVSFDGKASWKKWDGTAWAQIDTLSGIENIDFSAIGNNSAEITKGLKDYILQPGETSLDFAVELMSSEDGSTPSINKVEIKYY